MACSSSAAHVSKTHCFLPGINFDSNMCSVFRSRRTGCQIYEDFENGLFARYCPTTDTGLTQAIPCPAGAFCGEGTVSPELCPAGTFQPGVGAATARACQPCWPGHVSEQGARVCVPCEAGSYALASRAACAECGVGWFSAGQADSCTQCPACMTTKAGSERRGAAGRCLRVLLGSSVISIMSRSWQLATP